MTHRLLHVAAIALTTWTLGRTAGATPNVTAAGGTWAHGKSATLAGSGFGLKATAAPAVWDDGSGDPKTKWDYLYPFSSDPAFQMQYRTPADVTLADGVVGGVALPNPHTQRYLAGAHYSSTPVDANSGYMVAAGKVLAEVPEYTYINYYRAIDPSWHLNTHCEDGETSDCDHNFKDYDYAEGAGPYGDGNNIYFCTGSGQDPLAPSVNWAANYLEGTKLTINSVNKSFMDWYPSTGTVYSSVAVAGPGRGWQKIELVFKHASADGYHRVLQNNVLAWDVSLDDDGLPPGQRAETVIGGYAREYGDTEPYKGNWRYYADIYYDHSLARVILANAADYAKATIMEPQPPGVWSDGAIGVTVNLGALPDCGTVYAFVFDATGTPSAMGFPITLECDRGDGGTDSGQAPDAAAGTVDDAGVHGGATPDGGKTPGPDAAPPEASGGCRLARGRTDSLGWLVWGPSVALAFACAARRRASRRSRL
jgi:hypothetical protein